VVGTMAFRGDTALIAFLGMRHSSQWISDRYLMLRA